MLKIAICDDDLHFCLQAQNEVKKVLEDNCIAHNISLFQSGGALLEAGFSDIIFLDVEMNGMNGIETAERLRSQGSNSCIIFLTSHKKYVFSAFDVAASHYLLKPIDVKKLETVMIKIVGRLTDERERCYTVRTGTDIFRVPFSQIRYAEVFGRKISLHTEMDIFSFNGRLDELEAAFPRYFFRCHKSFLVNLGMVIHYDKENAELQGGDSVPIARRKYAGFGTAFLSFLQKEGDI